MMLVVCKNFGVLVAEVDVTGTPYCSLDWTKN